MHHIRLYRLRNEHRWLDREIRREERRPNRDELRIQELNRRKLTLRDQIFLAEAGLSPVRF